MEITIENIKEKNIKRFIDCFKFEASENKFQCLISGCTSKLSDKSVAIRHLRQMHTNLCKIVQSNKIETAENPLNNESIELRVKVNVNEILNAVVDLVTKHALPLCFVEYQAFKKIILPYRIALEQKGLSF